MKYLYIIFICTMTLCGCSIIMPNKWQTKHIQKKSYKPSESKIGKRDPLRFEPRIGLNVYKADTIHLDMSLYQIIGSPKTHQTFIVTNDIWKDKNFSEKKILEDPSCFILGYRMNWLINRFYLFPWRESFDYLISLEGGIIPDNRKKEIYLYPDSVSLIRETYVSYHYKLPPSYYNLLLVRGDVYNKMTHSWMDGYEYSWLNFPDFMGFYKLLVPIWEDKFWLRNENDK